MATTRSKTKADECLYLFFGSDEAAVNRTAQEAATQWRPEESWNEEVIPGCAQSVEEAVQSIEALRAALLTLPFFGGRKFIWWKKVNFLDHSVLARSPSIVHALEGLAQDLEKMDSASVLVLISASSLHQSRVFNKKLLQLATSRCFQLPDLKRGGEHALLERIAQTCQEKGLEAEPSAIEALYQAIGADFLQLESELHKLKTALGAETSMLTREKVKALVHAKPEAIVWDFCEAVLAGRAQEALLGLQDLLTQGESEVGLLLLLSGQIRLAALVGTLREAGMLRIVKRGAFANIDVTSEGKALLPKKKNGDPMSLFQLGKIAHTSQYQPACFWIQAVDLLYQAYRDKLRGATSKTQSLEMVLLHLFSQKKKGSS